MSKTTDLVIYKYQTYLDLCLVLVEEACEDLNHGRYDLAHEQLKTILDTFNDKTPHADSVSTGATLLQFPEIH